jgi:hypothetical protein
MKRADVFARDGYRCVYCGTVASTDLLSVDHVQPRVKGGDSSGGNVVTACIPCNTAKGSRSLVQFLLQDETVRRNFFQHARYVWPRHMLVVTEELVRRGCSGGLPGHVEGRRGVRSSSEPPERRWDVDDD